jgi:protein tyrosine/serine phosphatase
MRYVRIPMSTRKAPTAQQLETFLSIVNNAPSQPVYVHCVGGKHRTGVMTAVYRMTRDGISGAEAFAEMKRFKYGPDFLHPEFKSFVYEFDAKKKTMLANAGG